MAKSRAVVKKGGKSRHTARVWIVSGAVLAATLGLVAFVAWSGEASAVRIPADGHAPQLADAAESRLAVPDDHDLLVPGGRERLAEQIRTVERGPEVLGSAQLPDASLSSPPVPSRGPVESSSSGDEGPGEEIGRPADGGRESLTRPEADPAPGASPNPDPVVASQEARDFAGWTPWVIAIGVLGCVGVGTAFVTRRRKPPVSLSAHRLPETMIARLATDELVRTRHQAARKWEHAEAILPETTPQPAGPSAMRTRNDEPFVAPAMADPSAGTFSKVIQIPRPKSAFSEAAKAKRSEASKPRVSAPIEPSPVSFESSPATLRKAIADVRAAEARAHGIELPSRSKRVPGRFEEDLAVDRVGDVSVPATNESNGDGPAPHPIEVERMTRIERSVLTLAESVRELTERIPSGIVQEPISQHEVDYVAALSDEMSAEDAEHDWENHIIELLDLGLEPQPPLELPIQAEAPGISPWEHFLQEHGELSDVAATAEGDIEAADTAVVAEVVAAAVDTVVVAEVEAASPDATVAAEGEATPAEAETTGTGAVRSWVRSRPERREGNAPIRDGELEEMRDAVLDLAGRGVPVLEICEQVGLGRHEVQLILRTLFEERKPSIPTAESGTDGR